MNLTVNQTRILSVWLIIFLGTLTYVNSFSGDWVWDDASSILLHEHVQDPSKIRQLYLEDQHAFAGGQGNFYRPLLSTTFMLDFWLANQGPTIAESQEVIDTLNPLVFHIQSSLWHILVALLMFTLLQQLKTPTYISMLASSIYVIHPLHTEAITYISGRADAMSAAFILAGICVALTKGDTTLKQAVRVGVSALCFSGALFSKESALIYPVLLFLTLWIQSKLESAEISSSVVHRYAPAVPALVLIGVYGWLRTGPLSFSSASVTPSTPFFERIVETLQSFAYYFQLIFNPSHLHMERTLIHATPMTAIFGCLFLAICCGVGYMAYRSKRYRITFGIAWFVASWIPISGIFPLNAPMAEHWLYIPLIGFLLAFMEMIFNSERPIVSIQKTNTFKVAVAAIVFLWGCSLLFQSVIRNDDWSSNSKLYEATLRENPLSSRVQFNLAVTHQDILKNPVGAKRHYSRILDIYAAKKEGDENAQFWDEEIESHFSLGTLYLDERDFGEAYRHFSAVASIKPSQSNRLTVARSLYGMSRCLSGIGDYRNANSLYQQAGQLAPELGLN
jgi:hypothetical protein